MTEPLNYGREDKLPDAALHDLSNNLEALTNLVYLTTHDAGNKDKVLLYMELAYLQLRELTAAFKTLL